MAASWTPGWILDFLKTHKQGTPFTKLAEEAARSLQSSDDLRAVLVNVCALVDTKTNRIKQLGPRVSEPPLETRKRRRSQENTDSPTPLQCVDKRLRAAEFDENQAPGLSAAEVERRPRDGTLVIECSRESLAVVPDRSSYATVGEDTTASSIPVSPTEPPAGLGSNDQ
ncbi:hypothetical protein GNI_035530 [Gregarina niphandrodes]|uniref:Uncharacterized protein n=1 Tax=Gregarina niphandrodes TaxID=110365 RepID=A0A023BAW8_GRENI|nr:hypothetical protein GNI_035530 [Gregarina niphandrodes]EZG78497.1 hypothetical protein GNI_035530 [Gregarina niphandrodes]|eukprot:XP_011129281.1 hypothetical protein GNI_035530 [Gregarina niphandrodes]